MATLLEKCNNIKNDKELNLKPENLKAGVTCLGVTGTLEELDTSDATATASDIADGKTAYVNGELITGNVFTVGSNANYGGMGNLTVEDDANYSRIEVTHNFSMKTLFTKDGRASFYPSYDSVAEAIGLTANQILKGNTILGVEGIAEAGDNGNIKVFNTEEEMRAVEDGQEGDLAIIYGRRWTQMSHNLAFNAMEFPETIELTEPMPDWAGHFYLAPAVYETENSAYVIANYEPSTIVVRYATSANAPEEVFITYTSVDGIHFNADRTDNRILNLPNDVMATSLDVWILDYNKIAKVNAKTADIYMFYEDYGMTGWKNISNTTNAQEGLDTSDATAMPENLMQGYSAYAKGQKIEGTLQTVPVSSALMVNGIQVSDFEATVSYEVPETKVIEAGDGFWASVPFDVITSQQNIMPDQIVEGYRILGIDGTARLGYDTSDADAMAENIEPGYCAYTRDGLVYGNMNVAEGMTFDSVYDKDKPEYRIFYDESSNNIEQIFRNDNKVLLVDGTELDIRVSGADIVDAIGLKPDQILAGNTILGLEGEIEDYKDAYVDLEISTVRGREEEQLEAVLKPSFLYGGKTAAVSFETQMQCMLPYSEIAGAIGLTEDQIVAGHTVLGIEGAGAGTGEITKESLTYFEADDYVVNLGTLAYGYDAVYFNGQDVGLYGKIISLRIENGEFYMDISIQHRSAEELELPGFSQGILISVDVSAGNDIYFPESPYVQIEENLERITAPGAETVITIKETATEGHYEMVRNAKTYMIYTDPGMIM